MKVNEAEDFSEAEASEANGNITTMKIDKAVTIFLNFNYSPSSFLQKID
jgi:hypothetical protein